MKTKIDVTGALEAAIGSEHGITQAELANASAKLKGLKIDYAWMKLADDKKLIADCLEEAARVRKQFKNLVVLGIGGSALGVRCLHQALVPPYAKDTGLNLYVCDNIDPDHFGALVRSLDWKETFVNVISKSGKTTETAAQLYIVREAMIKALGATKWKEHVIVTTDPVAGPMRALVKEENLKSFAVPPAVGGRFSVLSSVGLLPAACMGIDIKELLDGAHSVASACKENDLEKNPALKNGAIHYIMDAVKHKPISVLMPYSDSLALFSDWYAQLWAESLGKSGIGPTPVKALGVTDQHSQMQLYMEGPGDKIITIVGTEKFKTKLPIPENVGKDFDYICGKDLGDVLHAEQKATVGALREAKRPVVQVTLPEISAFTLGELIMFYQIQTAVTGHLYGIDPFNQPGVELGKKLTREILSKG